MTPKSKTAAVARKGSDTIEYGDVCTAPVSCGRQKFPKARQRRRRQWKGEIPSKCEDATASGEGFHVVEHGNDFSEPVPHTGLSFAKTRQRRTWRKKRLDDRQQDKAPNNVDPCIAAQRDQHREIQCEVVSLDSHSVYRPPSRSWTKLSVDCGSDMVLPQRPCTEQRLQNQWQTPHMQIVAEQPVSWVQLRAPYGTSCVNGNTRQVTQEDGMPEKPPGDWNALNYQPRWEQQAPTRARTGFGCEPSSVKLRNPSRVVRSGVLLNLLTESFLTGLELQRIFQCISSDFGFRWFAGRSILDFKVKGESSLQLSGKHALLNPIVEVMLALAQRSLHEEEKLAVLQLIVNFFADGGNEVKPHRHRCRQICVSLGADRELEVEGKMLRMRSGSALPLRGEMHAVPPAARNAGPRVSICLFYGSKAEYDDESISVNSIPGSFGDSYWWTHPKDLPGGGRGGKGGSGHRGGKGKTEQRQKSQYIMQ